MLSSTNSGNPFQHLPSLFHHHHHHHHHQNHHSPPPLPPPFIPHESDHDTFLLHHHHHHHNHNDSLLGHFPPPPNASLSEAVNNMAVVSNNPIIMAHQDCTYPPSDLLPGKKSVKKDRHSKITTAKGPRERRVRLSIKIARKFFDLQDMLGFDKASRTLEWLLVKSKTAIKEVVRMKQHSRSLSSASECEVVSESGDGDGDGDPPDIQVDKKPSPGGTPREKRIKDSNKAAAAADHLHLLARESRAKARARARERTREKMCTKRLDELKNFTDVNHHIISQLRSCSQVQSHENLGLGSSSNLKQVNNAQVLEESSSRPIPPNHNHAQREDIIEESIFIKRKLKPSPLFACPQNLLFSKDLSLHSNSGNSNGNGNGNFPHPLQNWDINNPSTRPNSFCTMTNMNLSTEFQMFGKPWEAHNNLSLR